MTPARSVRDGQISDTIIRLATLRGPDKTICPSEVAREVAGSDPAHWRPLMAPIRDEAVLLAKTGKIEIKKSGVVVDPDDFSGIYRIAITRRC